MHLSKEVDEMKKRWHDIKRQTKGKVALNMVQMSKTGALNTASTVSGSLARIR